MWGEQVCKDGVEGKGKYYQSGPRKCRTERTACMQSDQAFGVDGLEDVRPSAGRASGDPRGELLCDEIWPGPAPGGARPESFMAGGEAFMLGGNLGSNADIPVICIPSGAI